MISKKKQVRLRKLHNQYKRCIIGRQARKMHGNLDLSTIAGLRASPEFQKAIHMPMMTGLPATILNHNPFDPFPGHETLSRGVMFKQPKSHYITAKIKPFRDMPVNEEAALISNLRAVVDPEVFDLTYLRDKHYNAKAGTAFDPHAAFGVHMRDGEIEGFSVINPDGKES